jgi:hypothetical protein
VDSEALKGKGEKDLDSTLIMERSGSLSSMCASDSDATHRTQEIKAETPRSVSWKPTVLVTLIPSRNDYKNAKVCLCLMSYICHM